MLRPVGNFVSGRRTKWIVLAVWAVVLAILVPLQLKLPDATTNRTTSFLPADAESARIGQLLEDRFEVGDVSQAILVYRRDGGLTPADRETLTDHARRAAAVPLAGRLLPAAGPGSRSEQISQTGEVAFTLVELTSQEQRQVTHAIEELREIVAERPAGLRAEVTGRAAVDTDLNEAYESADASLLYATVGLVLILLVAIYRSPGLALVPLTVVGVAYAAAGGIIYLLAESTLEVSSAATSLLLVLMFGAGTDYCLLLVARYSEDLRRTEDRHEAMAAAVARAGPAMLASGVTVMLALLAVTVAEGQQTRTLGPVNAIGVGVVLVASLTLLPALLVTIGRRGFWPSARLVAYRARAAPPKLLPGLGPLPAGITPQLTDRHPAVRERDGIWRRVGRAVLRRPVPWLVGVLLLLGLGATGLSAYEEQANILNAFREDNGSTRGSDLLATGFSPGALAPTTVVIDRRDAPLTPVDVETARRTVAETDGVLTVTDPIDRSRDGRATTFAVLFADDPYGNAALDRVAEIRERLARGDADVRALLGSGSAVQLDYREAANADLRRIVPVVLAVVFIVLVILLRALIAPLYLMASVVLSFFGILGFTLLFFTHVANEPGFDASFPTYAFIFLVALGVDYNIFLMDRVREEARIHGTREGLLRGLVATGPVITSAGLILAGTFAVLVTFPITFLSEVGFAVSVGVLLDTFLVRTVLVPAVATLLGDRSWFPSSLWRNPQNPDPDPGDQEPITPARLASR